MVSFISESKLRKCNSILLLYISDGTVDSTCKAICAELAKKTNSIIAGDVCLVLCTLTGAAAFIKILNK